MEVEEEVEEEVVEEEVEEGSPPLQKDRAVRTTFWQKKSRRRRSGSNESEQSGGGRGGARKRWPISGPFCRCSQLSVGPKRPGCKNNPEPQFPNFPEVPEKTGL